MKSGGARSSNVRLRRCGWGLVFVRPVPVYEKEYELPSLTMREALSCRYSSWYFDWGDSED